MDTKAHESGLERGCSPLSAVSLQVSAKAVGRKEAHEAQDWVRGLRLWLFWVP